MRIKSVTHYRYLMVHYFRWFKDTLRQNNIIDNLISNHQVQASPKRQPQDEKWKDQP